MANKVRWTPDQEDAINARGGSLVVSAAAGSGKTAVLVERCIQRLTDTENPCGADELLIVTFTRAATAEMRTRLAGAISEKLAEDPLNEHLQKQQMLLPSAQICTIDSFCGTLVRENFEQLGLAPDFRLLDESEGRVLKDTALEEVMEELYAENNPDFISLVELLASGRDDTSIEENIINLHTYSRAYPSPETWLNNALALYRDPAPAIRIIARSLTDYLDSWVLKWNSAASLLKSARLPEGVSFEKQIHAVTNYLTILDSLKQKLLEEDYEGFFDAVSSMTAKGEYAIPNMPPWPKDKETKTVYCESLVLHIKSIKETFTNSKVAGAIAGCLPVSPDEAAQDASHIYPCAKKLVEAVLRFDEVFTRLKREENALDFADTETLALQLLVKDPGKEPFEPTELALTLREQYREILIDEYQDTNKLQDSIFTAISNGNLFLVGDVKQSIYRFRQAMPELFLQKKEASPRYDKTKDEYPATVILGQNFRSREGVLDAVNYTFSQLMSKEVGDITYDETEKLYFGAKDQYKPSDQPDVEFHVVIPSAEQKKAEAEAAHIATFIAEEMEKSLATDTPLQYKDFAILLRTTTGLDTYRKTLTEYGIPVYAEAGSGFLETPEVMTIMSLLTIIDNPLQDIPLLSAMLSPLFGFSEDEIASIRIGQRKGNLFQAVLLAGQNGNSHCEKFLEELRGYRNLSVSFGAGELLRHIYNQTRFPSIVKAQQNGTQRAANLQQLLSLADSYDQNSSFGTSGFVRYMNRLAEKDTPLSTAATLSPNANVVQIMTIHKSKGLEFKVCIAADLSHQFNTDSLNRRLILHPELGLGLQGRQPSTGFSYPTLMHTALKLETRRSEWSEALRVLYVAMTRAKEKLVLCAAETPMKNPDKNPLDRSIQSAIQNLYTESALPPFEVLQSRSFYQWLLPVFLRHPDAAALRARGAGDYLTILKTDDASPVKFVIDHAPGIAPPAEVVPEEAVSADPELVEELLLRFDYEYPYAALGHALSKRSASHLSEKPFSTEYFAETRPGSLSRGGMTPAERGTCTHKFMQYADFDKAAKDLEAEKNRLVEQGFLLKEEAAVVDEKQVKTFFDSAIAERMAKSPRVLREHKFAILVPAGRFEKELSAEEAAEKVLIQGIIDCAFEEDGAMVLLDYKTDRVRDGEDLAARYRDQLELYQYALEETLELPVKETCLYSFHLGTTVIL